MIGINTLHRRKFRSGSCLEQHPLGEYVPTGRRFLRALAIASEEGRKRRNREFASPRCKSVPPPETPRSTRSLFGRFAAKVKGLFQRKAA